MQVDEIIEILRPARIFELLLYYFDIFMLSYYDFRTIVNFVIYGLLMYMYGCSKH